MSDECPICMDSVDKNVNRVITECGHVFHCSCLMQNAICNGFGCPYCRTEMAKELKPEEDDDEDEEDEEEEYEEEDSIIYDAHEQDNALTSFRMFNQQLDGEEVEEEVEELEEEFVEDASYYSNRHDAARRMVMPSSSYVAQKLLERGITYEDLIKNTLFQEHSSWDSYYTEHELRSQQVYGQFRAVIRYYQTHLPQVSEAAQVSEATQELIVTPEQVPLLTPVRVFLPTPDLSPILPQNLGPVFGEESVSIMKTPTIAPKKKNNRHSAAEAMSDF